MSIRQTTANTYIARVAIETINRAMPTPDASAAMPILENTPNVQYGGYSGADGRVFYATPAAAAAVQAALGKNFIVESLGAINVVCGAIQKAAFAQLSGWGAVPGLTRDDVHVYHDGPDGYSIKVEVDDPATASIPSPLAGFPATAIERMPIAIMEGVEL